VLVWESPFVCSVGAGAVRVDHCKRRQACPAVGQCIGHLRWAAAKTKLVCSPTPQNSWRDTKSRTTVFAGVHWAELVHQLARSWSAPCIRTRCGLKKPVSAGRHGADSGFDVTASDPEKRRIVTANGRAGLYLWANFWTLTAPCRPFPLGYLIPTAWSSAINAPRTHNASYWEMNMTNPNKSIADRRSGFSDRDRGVHVDRLPIPERSWARPRPNEAIRPPGAKLPHRGWQILPIRSRLNLAEGRQSPDRGRPVKLF